MSACGGGGSGGGSGGPQLATGIFTDAPVAGLGYRCEPSGTEGTTNAQGEYDYVDGDTVTFSLGDVELGTVAATGVVTPVDVAHAIAAATGADAQTVAINLLVFLQSLDEDGDPSNGIAFSSAIAAAASSVVVDFTASAEDFTASMTALVAAVQEAVPAATLKQVSREEAVAHFAEQQGGALAGTWRIRSSRPNGDPVNLTITFFQNGTYLMGGLENDPNCNEEGADTDGNGAEFGTYEWDSLTGAFTTGTPTVNTDGSCGLEGIPPGVFAVRVHGEELRLYELGATAEDCAGGGATFGKYVDGQDACIHALTRAANAAGTIVGSFTELPELIAGHPLVLTIESTATGFAYVLVDATSASGNVATEFGETDGTELGTFTLGNGGLVQNLQIQVDTNGQAGFSHAPGLTLTVTPEGRLHLTADEEGAAEFDRLPLVLITRADTAGSYFVTGFDETDTEVAQAGADFPAYLTFLANGEYLLGVHHDDPTCNVDEADQPDGNGIEYGRYSLDTLSGELTTEIPAPTAAARYVDTNGECGLVHKGGTTDRMFLRKLTGTDGEGLLLVTFDDSGDDSVADPAATLAAALQVRTIADAKVFAEGGDANFHERSFAVMRPVISRANAGVNQGLNGTWKLTASSLAEDNHEGAVIPVSITIIGDRYLLAHGTIGERPAIDGIEAGLFNVNGSAQFCVTELFVDTTADAGLAAGEPTTCSDDLTLSMSGGLGTFTLTAGADTFVFTRISREYAGPAP